MSKLVNFFIATEDNDYRPPILTYKAFVIYGLLLLLLRLFLGTLTTQGAAVESDNLMQLINKEREQRNLNTLTISSKLITAATAKSQDMIERDYFAHVDPDGNYVWYRIEAAGYKPYKILGENLAIDFSTAEGMIKAWIDSPSHRANLLHPDFVDQGLKALWGDYQGRYTNVTTSLFGALATVKSQTTQPPPPKAAPAPPPEPTPSPPPAPTPAPPSNPTPSPAKTSEHSTSTAQETVTPSTPNIEKLGDRNLGGQASDNAIAYPSAFQMSRLIFTLFGIILLLILATDSVIIYQHELQVLRSHSAYHFFSFMLIILVSILIWWW